MHSLTCRTKESTFNKSLGKIGTHAAFMKLNHKLQMTTVPGHTESTLNLPPCILYPRLP